MIAEKHRQQQHDRGEEDEALHHPANEWVSQLDFDELPGNQPALEPDNAGNEQLQPAGAMQPLAEARADQRQRDKN